MKLRWVHDPLTDQWRHVSNGTIIDEVGFEAVIWKTNDRRKPYTVSLTLPVADFADQFGYYFDTLEEAKTKGEELYAEHLEGGLLTRLLEWSIDD